jgi:hypothetical protein
VSAIHVVEIPLELEHVAEIVRAGKAEAAERVRISVISLMAGATALATSAVAMAQTAGSAAAAPDKTYSAAVLERN